MNANIIIIIFLLNNVCSGLYIVNPLSWLTVFDGGRNSRIEQIKNDANMYGCIQQLSNNVDTLPCKNLDESQLNKLGAILTVCFLAETTSAETYSKFNCVEGMTSYQCSRQFEDTTYWDTFVQFTLHASDYCIAAQSEFAIQSLGNAIQILQSSSGKASAELVSLSTEIAKNRKSNEEYIAKLTTQITNFTDIMEKDFSAIKKAQEETQENLVSMTNTISSISSKISDFITQTLQQLGDIEENHKTLQARVESGITRQDEMLRLQSESIRRYDQTSKILDKTLKDSQNAVEIQSKAIYDMGNDTREVLNSIHIIKDAVTALKILQENFVSDFTNCVGAVFYAFSLVLIYMLTGAERTKDSRILLTVMIIFCATLEKLTYGYHHIIRPCFVFVSILIVTYYMIIRTTQLDKMEQVIKEIKEMTQNSCKNKI